MIRRTFLLAAAFAIGATPLHADSAPPETVVLLHGLARSDRSMDPLAARLRDAGFEVHNLAYPSTKEEPEALVEIVDAFGSYAIFQRALGPTAQQLGTGNDSFPKRLPAPTVEVGVIAGRGTVNPVGSVILPDEDDGVVSVASAKLDGMKDFLLVDSSHTFIMRSPEVARQVAYFLRHGRFDRSQAER